MATVFKRRGKGNWKIQWFDARGVRREKSSRTTDKRRAQALADKLESDVMLRREGIIDPSADQLSKQRARPLAEHVSDYLEDLRDEGCSPRHIQTVKARLNRAIADIAAQRLTDLEPDLVKRHLRALGERPVKQLPNSKAKDRNIGPRTVNGVRSAILAFLNWAVKTERLPRNPCMHVPKRDESTDVRVKRRALTAEEVGRLVSASEKRGEFYLVAVLTGLRMKEMRTITWAQINFASRSLVVPATIGKADRNDLIALHDDVVRVLERIRPSGCESKDRVFPTVPTTRTFLSDLKRAGIAEYDSEGRRVDRHALRTTTGTLLARAGVSPQQAKLQMRHSEISTTIRHYTDLGLGDQARAVALIPRIEFPELGVADGGQPEAPADRQQKRQHKQHESSLTPAILVEGLRMPLPQVEDAARSKLTGICDDLPIGAKGNVKAGDRDRTGDIQLGNRLRSISESSVIKEFTAFRHAVN